MDNWFDSWFERFWNVYTTKLCRQKGASFEIAKKKYKTRIKSQKKADEIFATLLEQVRYRLKLKEEKAHQAEWIMPGILVYLNQERWEGFTIGSYTDIDDKPKATICGCGRDQPIAHKLEDMCALCRGELSRRNHQGEIDQVLTKMGLVDLGATQDELNDKCKKYIKENARNIIKGKIAND